MQLFFLHYTGNRCLPYWAVNTDDVGDFINLGLRKSQLDKLLLEKESHGLCNFYYDKVNDSGHYESNLYLADIFPPEIDDEGCIFSAFPYKDSYLDDDDDFTEEWELVNPEKHPYPKLYKRLHPDALVGIIEVIHSEQPSLIKDFHRCHLVGFTYMKMEKTQFHDAGNYFLSRHLVVLRPGDLVNFNAKVINNGEAIYYNNEAVSYRGIKQLLNKHAEK